MICDRCGREFDKEEEWDGYVYGFYAFANFEECLCPECAEEAIDNEEDGLYYETCEQCGKRFDYIEVNSDLSIMKGMSLREMEQILCLDCAIDFYNEHFHDSDCNDDDDVGERYSVYDAALAWASHGKDEDYMFGYTEEELEEALR